MAPVPKGNSSRGVLCADVSGKLYSGTLRRETIPCLVKLCEGQQFGAIPGGGTAVPSLALFCAIRRAQALRRPLGALFLDLRAAFYMSLTEVSLGALLGSAAREELLVSIGFTTEEITVFLADFVEGTPLLRQLLVKEGSAPAWHKAIADWHVRTWFCVAGGSRKCFTSSGTRPGDPLADEVFASRLQCCCAESARSLRALASCSRSRNPLVECLGRCRSHAKMSRLWRTWTTWSF